MLRSPRLHALLLAFLPVAASAGPVASFSDITNWTGSGTQEAALVIDWQGESSDDNALAWGYRWDGVATGEDMLRTVVAADDRLFAKLSGPSPQGIRVYGLGYDANDDSNFTTSDNDFFNNDGINLSGIPESSPPIAVAADPGDWYAEGWFSGFWHYGTAVANPYAAGQWFSNPVGATGSALADGTWNSWAFSPNLLFTAFAENPIAAAADATADLDADADVDVADVIALQRDFSTSGLEAWNTAFGQGGVTLAVTTSVPEPTSLTFLISYCFIRHLNRRDRS